MNGQVHSLNSSFVNVEFPEPRMPTDAVSVTNIYMEVNENHHRMWLTARLALVRAHLE